MNGLESLERTKHVTEAGRTLQRYAKRFNAGAFATPTRPELMKADLREWPATGTVAVVKVLSRPSKRQDWMGRVFVIPDGVSVVTHLARPDLSLPVPDLDEFDVIFAYRDDLALSAALVDAGREVLATQISAAGEIIGVWARPGWSGVKESALDLMTLAEVPFEASREQQALVLEELAGLGGWTDDYPFYSDGSWSALSLRGFRPDDPTWGVKPAEMNRKWHIEHPGAHAYRPGWTELADRCPTMRALVEQVPWWAEFERVRLLRMAGRGGKGGALGRHTDITDRAGGTLPGQVVRFHVPLITDPAVVMHTWALDGQERQTHLDPWRAWYLDTRKPHAVTNPTGCDRVHLVADVIVDSAVRSKLEAAARLDLR